MSCEEGASSVVIFARDNVDRVLSGNSAVVFNIVNTLLTVVPLALITWVLVLLWRQTFKKISGSNIVLAVCFLSIWGIVFWMLNRDFNTVAYDVSFQAIESSGVEGERGETARIYTPITESMQVADNENIVERIVSIAAPIELEVGQQVNIITKNKAGSSFGYLDDEAVLSTREHGEAKNRDNGIVNASVVKIKDSEVEITVSWFSILNSFFIILFASMFSKWWDSKYNPSAAMKYGLGLIIMSVGFGLLAFGAYGVSEGVKVSMLWLILAYLFHTLGELCLSPVGLSYVSKLVPARMIALMFGMWYLAIAIGNKLAAVLGGQVENITKEYDLSTFFLIFTIVPAIAGLIVIFLNPVLKKVMHGVR